MATAQPKSSARGLRSLGPQVRAAPPLDTVGALARAAWDEGGGSIQGAASILYLRLQSDQPFLAEHRERIVRDWCLEQIGGIVGAIRLASWTPPNADPTSQGARLRSAIRSTLLDFLLPGGKRLAEADANEVRDGAAFYRQQAEDMAWKARWLDKVATATGAKRVGDALTDSKLRKMQEDARAH